VTAALTVHDGGRLLVRAEPSSSVDDNDAIFLALSSTTISQYPYRYHTCSCGLIWK